MAVRQLKPTTPGSRHRIAPVFDSVTTEKPYKGLTEGIHKSGGRNSYGRKTSRHRGGGHKRKYRVIDFKRNKFDIPAKVQTIEYDPNRTARIALLSYADGEKRYIIAPDKLKVGDAVKNSRQTMNPDVGCSMPLSTIPLGTVIHAVELNPGRGAQLCRSAGTNAQLVAKEGDYATIKLPSGEVRRVPSKCIATIGRTSNPDHFNTTGGKAGRSRWKGIRPQTRGVAMNPVDHPMGGGEGKASGGHPRSPWGQMAKGKKTRDRKKVSNKFIVRRRNAKK